MPINIETQLILDLLKELGLFSFVSNNRNKFYYSKNKESVELKEKAKKEFSTNSKQFVEKQIFDSINTVIDTNKSKLQNNDSFLQDNYMVEDKVLQNAVTLPEVQHILNDFKGCSLAKTATNTVFGVGNHNADLLMIGEAPGAEEDLKGEPFVGRSGQLLTKALSSIGVQRSNIFITNSVFWRPPGNRNPTSYEVALCKPFLQKIISLVKPKIILIVGKVAATALLEEDIAIGKIRGKWLTKNWGYTGETIQNINVRVIYHPAYLLRNPKQKKVFWFDLIEISNKIEELRLNV